MKKLIFFSTTTFILVALFVLLKVDTTKLNASDEGGKWVAEYGGGTTPFRCYCVESFWRNQCRVGDFSGDLSLCEN